MGWAEVMSEAIEYIENHLTEELSVGDVADAVHVSTFYFQRGFSILCGLTVGEYIRRRRLSLAGEELALSNEKIIAIAQKYGYDSPDSFTKAFTRFHGNTPTAVRKGGQTMKSFTRLKIAITLKGGDGVEYKIAEKDSFTVIGAAKTFQYDSAFKEIPAFWEEYYQAGKTR